MQRERKKYEDLTITDDFMFGKVMHHPERCRKLLEIILGVGIREVVFLDDQDSMNPDYDAKGIRLDIYLEDADNTVYNVEMQAKNEGDLPERSRYYQAVIDINLIEKGVGYKTLKKSYLIFICTFDLFGKGRHIYHFENLCREDPTIRLNDGTEKVFLNTKGAKEGKASLDDVGEDLRNLLGYFESNVPRDAYTRELEEAVRAAKEHREWRREYMKLEAMAQRIRWEGKEEGREEGRIEGREEGREEGRTEGEIAKLVSLVYRKAVKGKTPEAIAEDLEEEFGEVRRIYDVVVKYIPDYDPEKILEELLNKL